MINIKIKSLAIIFICFLTPMLKSQEVEPRTTVIYDLKKYEILKNVSKALGSGLFSVATGIIGLDALAQGYRIFLRSSEDHKKANTHPIRSYLVFCISSSLLYLAAKAGRYSFETLNKTRIVNGK